MMVLKIKNENNGKLGTIEKVFENGLKPITDKVTKILRTQNILQMLDVLIIKYQRFHNSSVAKKLSDNVKCKLSVTFNGILYNLKGAIMHRGETIENGKYCGIFSNILFDNSDNIFDIETIKQKPKEFKKKNEASIFVVI